VLKQKIETYTIEPCIPTMIEDQKITTRHSKWRVIFEGTTILFSVHYHVTCPWYTS
jgi:hypothetical protein